MRGFSLLELLLVMTIISTVTLISVPFYARFLTQNTVANATDQLVNSLRKAQMYSMMGKQSNNCTGAPCNWGVNYTGNTITLYLGNSFANRTQTFDERFSVSTSVSITSSTETTDWNFTRVTGFANNTPATITISGTGNQTKTLSVIGQGTVNRN